MVAMDGTGGREVATKPSHGEQAVELRVTMTER